MKSFNFLTRTLVVALTLGAPIHALAQGSAPELADGEVRKIDKDAGKITLKHGPIKSLDMPGMTMVFYPRDKALLDKVKVGDKVQFQAVSEGGKIVLTEIEAAK